MTSAHDRYEALAGAIALGEATADERGCFEAHARDCARCGEDAAAAPLLRAFVETTRDAESWRPSMRDAVFARIHERRLGHSRAATGALGWAFAASVVLNAAVVSGAAGSLGRALRDRESSSDVVASHVRIEKARSAGVPTPLPLPAVYHSVRVREAMPRAHTRIAAAPAHLTRVPLSQSGPASVAPPPIPKTAEALEASVDDILEGLDVAAAHGLAAAPLARCGANAEQALTPPDPCETPRAGETP